MAPSNPMRRITAILALLAAPTLLAAETALADLAAQVAPFLEAQTLVVAHLDPGRLDVDSVFGRLLESGAGVVPPEEQQGFFSQLDRMKEAVSKWTSSLQTAGGRGLFVALSPADLPGFYAVVPLAAKHSVQGLSELLRQAQPWGRHNKSSPLRLEAFDKVGDALFAGAEAAADRLAGAKPVPRPELAEAFAAAEAAPVRVALIPSSDCGRVLHELPCGFPDEIGGGNTGQFTDGLTWASLSLDPAPGVSLRLVIHYATEEDVTRAADAFMGLLAKTGEILAAPAGRSAEDGHWEELTPEIAGTQLTVSLSHGAMIGFVEDAIGPAIRRARSKAKATASMSNIKQLLLACMVFANEHKNQFPADIYQPDVKKYLGNAADTVLRNPREPKREKGYAYIGLDGPITKLRSPATRILIYEAHDAWPADGLNVGFADGHVERIMDEHAFKRKLADAMKGQAQ